MGGSASQPAKTVRTSLVMRVEESEQQLAQAEIRLKTVIAEMNAAAAAAAKANNSSGALQLLLFLFLPPQQLHVLSARRPPHRCTLPSSHPLLSIVQPLSTLRIRREPQRLN